MLKIYTYLPSTEIHIGASEFPWLYFSTLASVWECSSTWFFCPIDFHSVALLVMDFSLWSCYFFVFNLPSVRQWQWVFRYNEIRKLSRGGSPVHYLDCPNEKYWLDAIFSSLAFHKRFLEANNNLIGSHPTARKRQLTLFLTVQSNVKFKVITI